MTGPAPAWARVLSWAVRRLPRGRYAAVARLRLRAEPFVATLPSALGGARFECDLGDDIAREAFLTGTYEPPVTRFFQHYVHQGSVVIDAGANWGYFSLLAAAAAGRTGHVYALEPEPRHAAQLTRNRQLNAFDQLEPLEKGAAASAGPATLIRYADGDRNRGLSRVATEGEGVPIECVRLDDVGAGRPAVDLVKIDVEGSEAEVLEGMRDGLAARRYRAIVLELHPGQLGDRGVRPEDCIRRLAEAGYAGWTIDLSPSAYRRALSPATAPSSLLLPLDAWKSSAWPHLLWLAPGVDRP